MFKESFTEYNQGSENTLSGPQEAFAFSLLEGADASRNVYNTYNSYYKIGGDRAELERRELERRRRHELEHKDKKDDKDKEEPIDNSLLFMGLGVAALGATVIVVMALRK